MTFDLRLGDGGNTKARTVSVGDVLTLQVYAIVTGTDGLDNEGLQFAWGSILASRTGTSVGGNLSSMTLAAPFNATASQPGTPTDLNGDGFLDLGSNATTQNGNFILARASGMQTNGVRIGSNQEQFFLGTLTYTVTAAGDSSTTGLNFRIANFTGDPSQRNSLFQVDGAAKNDLTGTLGTGASVLLSSGLAQVYWRGNQGSSWNTDNLGATNFATDINGGTDAGVLPGSATDVFFTTTNATNFTSTTLDKNFSIHGLTFTGNATGSVGIGSGAGGAFALTLGAGGVTVQAGSGKHTISSDVALAAAQTWAINNSSSNFLTVSGSISGGATSSLTKDGMGLLLLTGNNTFTGATIVAGGTLVAGGAGALGGTSSITVQSGAQLVLTGTGNLDRINNAAKLTLAGGRLVRTNGVSEGTAPTGPPPNGTGGSVGFGILQLSANSSLDFGTTDVGTLVFTDFSPQTFTLTIDNWTAPEFASNPANYTPSSLTDDRLIFNHDQAANLASFNFTGYTGARELSLGNGFFEVIPDAVFIAVPETSTVFVCLALLGLVGWRQRGALLRAGRWVFTFEPKES